MKMKISKKKLAQIIKEEVSKMLTKEAMGFWTIINYRGRPAKVPAAASVGDAVAIAKKNFFDGHMEQWSEDDFDKPIKVYKSFAPSGAPEEFLSDEGQLSGYTPADRVMSEQLDVDPEAEQRLSRKRSEEVLKSEKKVERAIENYKKRVKDHMNAAFKKNGENPPANIESLVDDYLMRVSKRSTEAYEKYPKYKFLQKNSNGNLVYFDITSWHLWLKIFDRMMTHDPSVPSDELKKWLADRTNTESAFAGYTGPRFPTTSI
jgi:hypothetical protein